MRLSTVLQACHASSRHGIAAPAHYDEAAGLLAVLRLVQRRAGQLLSGCLKLNATAVIFWPHLLSRPELLQAADAEMFAPLDLAVPPLSPAEWTARFQQHLTFLVQHLTLCPEAAEYRPLKELYRHAYLEPGVPESPAFADDRNYLAFRLIRQADDVARRVVVAPSLSREQVFAESSSTPGALLALYAAWNAITRRAVDPFDPLVVGIDYVSTGHLLINWELFSQSRFWPQEVQTAQDDREAIMVTEDQQRLSGHGRKGPPIRCLRGVLPPPRDLPEHFRHLPWAASVSAGIIDVDLQHSQLHFGQEQPTVSAALCRELPFFSVNAHGHAPVITLIDPLVLTNPRLFNPRWHARHHYRRVLANQRRATTTSAAPPVSRSRVYTLQFRPADYLEDFLQPAYATALRRARDGAVNDAALTAEANSPWPFANDRVEKVYAVKQKGQLCFTFPRHLLQEFEAEREVFARFLKLMYVEEAARNYNGSDDSMAVEIEQDSHRGIRSEYYAAATEQVIYEETEDRYRHLIAQGGAVGQKALAEAEALARRDFRAKTGSPPRRWFFEKVLPRMTHLRHTVEELRTRRLVPLPGQRQPQLTSFFTPRAVAALHECGYVSMRQLIRVRVEEGTMIAPTAPLAEGIEKLLLKVSLRCRNFMTEALGGAAPLLLAWTRFCQQYTALGTTAAPAESTPRRQGEDHTGWTLAQDAYLLSHYRRHPSLSTQERQDLTDQLGRDERVWARRVCWWRTQLPFFLHPSTARRLVLGRQVFTEEQAWRIVLHWGLYRLGRTQWRHTFNAIVQPRELQLVWQTPWTRLRQLPLPAAYRDRLSFDVLSRRLLALDDAPPPLRTDLNPPDQTHTGDTETAGTPGPQCSTAATA
jgi:hypothetical protein